MKFLLMVLQSLQTLARQWLQSRFEIRDRNHCCRCTKVPPRFETRVEVLLVLALANPIILGCPPFFFAIA